MIDTALERVLIVEEGPNPSTDFFVLPLLDRQGIAYRRYRFDEVPDPAVLSGAAVVFVRYLPSAWRHLVTQERDRLAEVVLFLDDDLLDWRAGQGMPLKYRWKLFNLIWRHQSWLRAVGARLWVSNDFLAGRCAGWSPEVVEARAPSLSGREPPLTVFYHGSASHRAEARWLLPVIEQVLEADHNLCFEIIADPQVRQWYAGLPRVHVLYPMRWPSYRRLLLRGDRAIGLAPLLDNAFNRARSPTKFYDITTAGAVGIYARGSVYDDLVQDGVNGLAVPMDTAAWARAILALAGDADRRARLLSNARTGMADPQTGAPG